LDVPVFPHPLLVGDIGGTNARFALADRPGVPPTPLARLKTAAFPGPAEAIASLLPGLAEKPRSAILCGAGPLIAGRLKLTNAPWVLEGPAFAAAGLERGLILNDFEAQALSLPAIPEPWVFPIGDVGSGDGGTRLILGPGTGLGTAALLTVEGRYVPVSSEACHIDFGPGCAPDEEAVWPHLERPFGRVTTESVMSGPGLVRLHRARLAAAGVARTDIDGASVVEAALADPGCDCAETVRMFLRIVARFAGDMAITFMATGGVTLAGGILPRMKPLIDAPDFRRCFELKEPVARLARRIPTRLVIEPDSVLVGMAAVGADPERYALDYAGRLWSAA
jgi:glucokinase